MKARDLIICVGLALIPMPAFAFPIEDFDGLEVMSHHVFLADHRVIGPGAVGYYEHAGFCVDDDCVNAARLRVSDCRSGQTLEIGARWEKDGHRDSYNRQVLATQILDNVADAAAAYSLAEVKVTFEGEGFEVREYMQSKENCACAAAFPELRNGKEKFEGL